MSGARTPSSPANYRTRAPRLTGVERFLARERARDAAYYREFPPAPDLAEVVACGWIRVVRHGAARARPLPVVPDGCADILACNDAEPLLVGPDTQTRWLSFPEGFVITALRLRPGALRAVIGCNATEVLDASVALSNFGGNARRLSTDLLAADTLRMRCALLEAWVRARVAATVRDRAVTAACRVLAQRPDTDIGRIASTLGWNVRMLHREFTAVCGYGPKHMQRILRVQRTLQIAHASCSPLRLGELTAGAGFSDQAHMSRDFRAITGCSPGGYLGLVDPGLGNWITGQW